MISTAFIVIDTQAALFDGPRRPFEADVVVDRLNALMARAREAGAPVVLVQHERPGTPLEHGAPGWTLAARLDAREEDAVIAKSTPDSFLDTGLQALLERHGVKRVVIGGYASEFCVDTTVRRAAALGYDVVVAADAHTTHDKPHADGATIRAHENATLPAITSFAGAIRALPSAQIDFVREDLVRQPDAAELRVRVATREDIAEMQRIRYAVRENRLVRLRIADEDYVAPLETTGRGWVAEAGGRMQGFAIVDASRSNVWALFVDPAGAARGAGRALHDAMIAWSEKQPGLSRLWLTTQGTSRAERFYAAAGWTRMGEKDGDVRFERDV